MAGEEATMDIGRLVAEYHQAVYAYAYRLSRSASDAEDLTQQAFLVAQEKLGQLRNPESARSWLFTILRNRFLKERQQTRPVPVTDLQLDVDMLPDEVPQAQDIDREQLQAALDGLPEPFRVVVLMYYFEDLAYREIAAKLDVPIGTVMSRLARAKRHLRSKLFVAEEKSVPHATKN